MKSRVMDFLTDGGTLPIYIIPSMFLSWVLISGAFALWVLGR